MAHFDEIVESAFDYNIILFFMIMCPLLPCLVRWQKMMNV